MGTRADLSERDRRLERTREAMARESLDALIVAGKGHWWTGRGYLRYFTDFHLWGHDGLLLIPLDDKPVMTLSSYAVARRIATRGWITDVRGDVFIAPRFADAVKEKGLASGRLGVAGWRYIIAAGTHTILEEALPDADLAPADDLMDAVRAPKSPLEIQQIRELWDLSKSAMEHFVEIVEPGKTQRELAAEASRLVLEAGARDILVFVGEQPDNMNPPRDMPVKCNDILRYHMEICNESGHWSEITVSCAYRDPTELETKLMHSELRAYDEIRKIATPGTTLTELAQTFERVMREESWELGPPTNHFDFHGQGMDTIERPWHAAAEGWGQSEDRPLEAGMVFSYHPRRKVRPEVDWGTGINEDILITPDGAERLSGDWDLRWRRM